ncbi:tetratricopeptide repeat protein [bacterium]|nr:tetratricopeptide repeat protein [bacterium]MCP5462344.1 tetratricopeptide repeat protein [bacterium]
MRWFFLTLLAISLIGISGCGPTDDEDFFKDDTFFENKVATEITPQEKIDQYKQILEIDPQDFRIRNNLGVVYAQLKLYDEAIKEFNLVLEQEPNYTTALLNMGSAYGDKGALDKAIETFQRAIEIDPAYAKAHQNLGVAYFRNEQYKEAITPYEKFVELNNGQADESTFYNLALSYKELQNKEKTEFYLRKVLEVNPTNELAKSGLQNIDAFMQDKTAE